MYPEALWFINGPLFNTKTPQTKDTLAAEHPITRFDFFQIPFFLNIFEAAAHIL